MFIHSCEYELILRPQKYITPYFGVLSVIFQLKVHFLAEKHTLSRDENFFIPLIELIFTGLSQHTLAMLSTNFHPNPMTLTEVIKRFRLKEHLYTFELPPKRDPPPIEFIFTRQHWHKLPIFPTKFE